MKLGEILDKFKLYIISLWLLFLLIIVATVDIPICLSSECEFIGLQPLVMRNIVPCLSLIFLLLGVHFYFRFEHRIAGSMTLTSEIEKIEDLNYEHLTFLTTYIIPLISFNLSNVRYAIALAILLIVVGIIYVKTDKFYANPTLAVLGFRLYWANVETRTGTKENFVLISKDRLSVGSQIRRIELDEKVCYARKAP